MTKSHLDFLQTVANNDVSGLLEAEKAYGSSWKKRGGVGAFMMLARKWDRIEQQVKKAVESLTHGVTPYDILEHALQDDRPEGIRDDIRDLRRYLMLVEAELYFLDWEGRQEVAEEVYKHVEITRTNHSDGTDTLIERELTPDTGLDTVRVSSSSEDFYLYAAEKLGVTRAEAKAAVCGEEVELTKHQWAMVKIMMNTRERQLAINHPAPFGYVSAVDDVASSSSDTTVRVAGSEIKGES